MRQQSEWQTCLDEEPTFMFKVTGYVHGWGIEVSFLASKESQSAS